MEKYNFETLSTLLGQTLRTRVDDTEVELEILDVARTATHGDKWDAFALYLKHQNDDVMFNQGIYEFSHPELGTAQLFVSPNSHEELEIIFSRRIQPQSEQ
ncbi:DUF6916 family protein [Vibrio navarrensis]|uniref:DUF6916 domain-containing protein n=1 Tax=Vibrio navarrensis TaxID=29495 RepID=A0AAJ4ID40_9VIBR|nr:hypothetical protein [Vibrio navarrensis]MBE3652709.1 hypothetical protein [Vibrio navarrensis]QPL54452.1 hypothetical protein I3X05_04775 [Vibrio navarrensis]